MDRVNKGLVALEELYAQSTARAPHCGIDANKLDRGFGRFASFLDEMLSGYGEDLVQSLGNLIEAPKSEQEIFARKISFVSVCEHHLVPFFGEVRISYVPDSKICGYGGLFNVINALSRRLQLQERLTHEIAQFIYKQLEPKRVVVQIRARHLCTALKEGSNASILETKVMLGETLRENLTDN